MHKTVARHLARYPSMPVSEHFKELLQVELDMGPALRTSMSMNKNTTGPGPSPLSSARPPSSSCITIEAAGAAMRIHNSVGKAGQVTHGWRQKAEDGLWLASAFFIIFYGDFHSNFFSLLTSDPRIARVPLLYGTACLLLNCMILLFFLVVHAQLKRPSLKKKKQHEEYITAAASTVFTGLGFAAFVMLSIALWPVWYILTFPLLFTLFMALVVLSSYALPLPLPWSSLLQEPAAAAYGDVCNFTFQA
ncbi:hypothetical protein L7F22_004223 [Adiantum nelumboides]|nr:hypothetical protein [Adiantum nelumboides]